MRKWVVIAAAVLGIAIALFLRPQQDSVEYHINGYKAAERRVFGRKTFVDELRHDLRKLLGLATDDRRDWRDLEVHQRELIRLGYLEEQTFVISNATLRDLGVAVQHAAAKRSTNWDFYIARMDRNRTNGLRVVMRKGNMPTQEEVLREIEATAAKTNR